MVSTPDTPCCAASQQQMIELDASTEATKAAARAAELERRCTGLAAARDTLTEQLRAAQEATRACEEALGEERLCHRRAAEGLRDEAKALQAQLVASQDASAEAQRQVLAAREELHALLACRAKRDSALGARATELQASLAAREAEVGELRAALAARDTLTDALEKGLGQMRGQIEKLRGRLKHQAAAADGCERRTEEAVAAGEQLAAALAASEAASAEAKQRAAAAEAHADAAIAQQRTAVGELRMLAADKKAREEELQGQVAAVEAAAAAAQEGAAALQASLDEAQQQASAAAEAAAAAAAQQAAERAQEHAAWEKERKAWKAERRRWEAERRKSPQSAKPGAAAKVRRVTAVDGEDTGAVGTATADQDQQPQQVVDDAAGGLDAFGEAAPAVDLAVSEGCQAAAPLAVEGSSKQQLGSPQPQEKMHEVASAEQLDEPPQPQQEPERQQPEEGEGQQGASQVQEGQVMGVEAPLQQQHSSEQQAVPMETEPMGEGAAVGDPSGGAQAAVVQGVAGGGTSIVAGSNAAGPQAEEASNKRQRVEDGTWRPSGTPPSSGAAAPTSCPNPPPQTTQPPAVTALAGLVAQPMLQAPVSQPQACSWAPQLSAPPSHRAVSALQALAAACWLPPPQARAALPGLPRPAMAPITAPVAAPVGPSRAPLPAFAPASAVMPPGGTEGSHAGGLQQGWRGPGALVAGPNANQQQSQPKQPMQQGEVGAADQQPSVLPLLPAARPHLVMTAAPALSAGTGSSSRGSGSGRAKATSGASAKEGGRGGEERTHTLAVPAPGLVESAEVTGAAPAVQLIPGGATGGGSGGGSSVPTKPAVSGAGGPSVVGGSGGGGGAQQGGGLPAGTGRFKPLAPAPGALVASSKDAPAGAKAKLCATPAFSLLFASIAGDDEGSGGEQDEGGG